MKEETRMLGIVGFASAPLFMRVKMPRYRLTRSTAKWHTNAKLESTHLKARS